MTLVPAVAFLALAQLTPPPPPANPPRLDPPRPPAVAPAPPDTRGAPPRPVPGVDGGMPPAAIAGPLAPEPGAVYAFPPRGAPALAWDRPSRCLDRRGLRYRAQCDPTAGRCLVAADAELGPDGEPRAALDRAPECDAPMLREAEVARFDLVPALAEAPPGWHRDERGRVMQVNFDLNRRAWLGAGWTGGISGQRFPRGNVGEGQAGIRWDLAFLFPGSVQAIARTRILETYAAFDGSMADTLVLGADLSRAYPSPLFRLTTFVGRPRRFDPPLYLGAYVEAFRVETLKTQTGRWYDRGSGLLALTADLWRSRDLSSFVRLRAGAGLEAVDQWGGIDWTPEGGLDADVGLDGEGFHHLRAFLVAESVRRAHRGALPAALDRNRTRYTGKLEYEVILLAVNDQPLSLVVDVRGQRRDDVPDYPTTFKWAATGAVRFSLFAPPRRTASTQDHL